MAYAQLNYALSLWTGQGLALNRPVQQSWAPGETNAPVVQQVSLAGNAFTALSPPTGATFCLIALGDAVSLTLKGITGDTGIALTPAANPLGIDAMFPVSSPTLGIANGSSSAQTVTVIWL